MNPIGYTYMADTHCPPCAIAAFGQEPGHFWPRDDARDAEGNPIGAIFSWDEWHEPATTGRFTLSCGTCEGVIDTCDHGPQHEQADADPGDECTCDNCKAGAEFTTAIPNRRGVNPTADPMVLA